jgi:hypothetical protein
MDITLPTASPLTIATSQLERACRMAKGLHLLKARLQAVHYRMLSAGSIPAPAATAREWADELSAIMRGGGIPEGVEQALVAAVQSLKEL